MERPVNLLPGPAQVSPRVRAAFAAEPISHRSSEFQEAMRELKANLCELLQARHVEILLGSGTLANDVIAGQLSLLGGSGLILSSGEFGERLLDHASRWGLACTPVVKPWGDSFDALEIRDAIAQHSDISWLWAVHCETSTGVLTDIEMLQELCTQAAIKLCLDCISSIGTVPCNLQDVWLASGVSGKGLRGLGLALVFYNYEVEVAPTLPRYLDLGFYVARGGIPFSHSSNLIKALAVAVRTRGANCQYANTEALASWLRQQISALGLNIVALHQASPAVITIALPPGLDSQRVGARLAEVGYLLSYQSPYLLERNWVQICLFSECKQARLEPLVARLENMTRAAGDRYATAQVTGYK